MNKREHITVMPDMTIFMNLMIVLVPLLLATAQFSQISILDLKSSVFGSGGSGIEKDLTEKLKLSLLVSDSTLTIASDHSVFPSFAYKVVSGEKYESSTLIAINKNGEEIYGWYSKDNQLFLNIGGEPAKSANLGDTLYLERGGMLPFVVGSDTQLENKLVQVTHLVSLHLREIYRTYPNVEDRGELTVGSEDEVLYDYLVQLMDAATVGGYEKLAFAKIKS
jgi:hypothetical protein